MESDWLSVMYPWCIRDVSVMYIPLEVISEILLGEILHFFKKYFHT